MGQAPSERMAALILDEEGFESIDPAHPLGGKDGGADAVIQKDGEPWVMAVYFPRGQQSIKEVTDKLTSDVEKAKSKQPKPVSVAFVTNQELRLAEREELGKVGGDTKVEVYHLELITTILDRPHMAGVREQFLGIPAGPPPILVTAEAIGVAHSFIREDELLDTLVDIEGGPTSVSCSPRELDQRGVGDVRAFLLQPVPAPGTSSKRPRLGISARSEASKLGGVVGGDHHVAVAGQKQRGWGDLGAIPRRGERPVVVDVAVPVQRAEEVRLGELFDVGGDIPLGQPAGQLLGVDPPVEETLVVWDQQPPDFGVVAGEAEQDAPQ